MSRSEKDLSLTSSEGKRFVVSSLIFILFLCLLAIINEFRFEGLRRLGRCALSSIQSPIYNHSSYSSNVSLSSEAKIRIFIGILTLPDLRWRRDILRMVYGTQSPAGAQIDVKFVFCNLTNEDQKVLVALELMRFDDIIILNCTENMNKGKTYSYFSSLPGLLNSPDKPYPPYHYVLKADDDTFFRLDNMLAQLRPLPREDLYYGFVIPCFSMDPFAHYMSGMGFLVSWDIVEWISVSDIPPNHLVGPEDQVFGEWLRDGRKGRNRYNAKWTMYNFPSTTDICAHDFWPNTTAVHVVKNHPKWVEALKYFNFTSNLKPSKLYHIT